MFTREDPCSFLIASSETNFILTNDLLDSSIIGVTLFTYKELPIEDITHLTRAEFINGQEQKF